MRQWWMKLRALVGRARTIDDDLTDEMRAHFDMEVAEGIDSGLTREQAVAAAHGRFGNQTLIRERSREAWSFPALESVIKDLQYGLRTLRRSPVFAVTAILTLALGIGINTAMFSVVNSVLLKPLPYPQPERLVWLGEATDKTPGISISWVNFTHWRDSNRSFDGMAAFLFTSPTLTGRSEPVLTRGIKVTNEYFRILGMRALMGRFFGPVEDRPSAAATLVLDHRFWSSTFGGDPEIVGKTVKLDGELYEVIGVAAPVWHPRSVDFYVPLGRAAGSTAERTAHDSIRAIGRLKAGVTLSQGRTDLDSIMRNLAATDPGPENDHRSHGEYFTAFATGGVRSPMLLVMSAAALVLLIACANVASLLLARSTARLGELSVRAALGAGRFRLVRQMVTESVLIACLGGLAGLALAYLAVEIFVSTAPRGIPRIAEISLDASVLLFSFAITVATGVLAGVGPVATARRVDLNAAMRDSSRTVAGSHSRQLARNLLVVGQIALTFVLVFGSGILLRSLLAAQNSNPGFDIDRLLALTLSLPETAYKDKAASREFYTRLRQDLLTLPGVTSAAVAQCTPGEGGCGDWFYSGAGGSTPARNEVPIAFFNAADADYFQTMRIPVRQGRTFNSSDTPTGPSVAVVNETVAKTWWPGESAVGQQIKVGGPYMDGPLLEIVGVVGDVKQGGLDSEPGPEIYLPFSKAASRNMAVLIRTSGDPDKLIPAIRQRVLSLDRDLPSARIASLEKSLGAGLERRQFNTLLLLGFAALAMILAAVGIYGLLSYWVSIREPEIAIRLALGARPVRILCWSGFHGLRLALIGIALGLVGGSWMSRTLASMVFGVAPFGAETMVGAALAVLAIALAATAIPAWRASSLDAGRRLQSV